MKHALITGAAAGIGLEIATLAAAKGYQVSLVDLDEAGLARAADGIKGANTCAADVTDEASVSSAFDEFGTPDLVVNNAGIVRFGPLIDQSVDDFRQTVAVNLTGTYIVAREAARRMGAGGHIVNITSINSITPGPGAGAYPATKAAIKQLTRQLAIELGDKQIRVNAVSPGFIDAGMSAPIYADEAVKQRRAGAVPIGRLGSALDIANAVMFLDSAEGAYINGHELVVDGGVVYSLLNQLPRD